MTVGLHGSSANGLRAGNLNVSGSRSCGTASPTCKRPAERKVAEPWAPESAGDPRDRAPWDWPCASRVAQRKGCRGGAVGEERSAEGARGCAPTSACNLLGTSFLPPRLALPADPPPHFPSLTAVALSAQLSSGFSWRMAQKENAYPWPYNSLKVRSWPHSSPHLPRKASPSDAFPERLRAEPSRPLAALSCHMLPT